MPFAGATQRARSRKDAYLARNCYGSGTLFACLLSRLKRGGGAPWRRSMLCWLFFVITLQNSCTDGLAERALGEADPPCIQAFTASDAASSAPCIDSPSCKKLWTGRWSITTTLPSTSPAHCSPGGLSPPLCRFASGAVGQRGAARCSQWIQA